MTTNTQPFNCHSSSAPEKRKGFTLPEMIVSVFVTGVILATLATSMNAIMNRSSSMAHYAEMDAQAKRTQEYFLRDVQPAKNLLVLNASNFVLESNTGGQVQYAFNQQDRTLRRVSGADSRVLLKNVDTINFTYETVQGTTTTKTLDAKRVKIHATLVSGGTSGTENKYEVAALGVLRNKTVGN